jgi:hypothetical protein
MFPFRPTKDFLAGIMFMAFGVAGILLGRPLDIGSASAMGAGYFPLLLSLLLLGLGAVLAVTGLIGPGETPSAGDWRAFIFIILSSTAFAVLLRPLGLVIATAATVLVASLAARMIAVVPLLSLTAFLALLNVTVFVWLLDMPIALWPRGF